MSFWPSGLHCARSEEPGTEKASAMSHSPSFRKCTKTNSHVMRVFLHLEQYRISHFYMKNIPNNYMCWIHLVLITCSWPKFSARLALVRFHLSIAWVSGHSLGCCFQVEKLGRCKWSTTITKNASKQIIYIYNVYINANIIILQHIFAYHISKRMI